MKAGYLLAGEVGEDELFADTASALAFTVGYHLATLRASTGALPRRSY